MFHCAAEPGIPMVRRQTPQGGMWECESCGGRAMTVALLRKLRSKAAVSEMWVTARAAPEAAGRSCPSCDHAMHVVGTGEGTDHLEVDICVRCHFVFFDPGEFEATPGEAVEDPKELPLEARRALAMVKVEAVKKRAEEQMGPDAHSPLAWIPLVFGLPVEMGTHRVSRVPVLTWSLAAITVVVYVATFGSIQETANAWGLLPAEPFRMGGVTFLTSFFLHVGVAHLLANLYFWLAFGDNLEEVLGWGRYLGLLVGATLVGGLVHVALNMGATIPVIGASGGVSGLLVAYIVRFPRARVGLLIFFQVVRAPAWAFLVFWLGTQILGLFIANWSGVGASGVAFGAHLGGAAVGALLGWRWRAVD